MLENQKPGKAQGTASSWGGASCSAALLGRHLRASEDKATGLGGPNSPPSTRAELGACLMQVRGRAWLQGPFGDSRTGSRKGQQGEGRVETQPPQERSSRARPWERPVAGPVLIIVPKSPGPLPLTWWGSACSPPQELSPRQRSSTPHLEKG